VTTTLTDHVVAAGRTPTRPVVACSADTVTSAGRLVVAAGFPVMAPVAGFSVRPRGRVHESKRVAFGFVLGLVDRFSSASQPPDRHRATSLPTQTLEIPYWRATAPWD
jgi:hypothetical protein